MKVALRRRALAGYVANDCPLAAAAIAHSVLLSGFPLILLVLTIGSCLLPACLDARRPDWPIPSRGRRSPTPKRVWRHPLAGSASFSRAGSFNVSRSCHAARDPAFGGGSQTVNLLHVDDLVVTISHVLGHHGADSQAIVNVSGEALAVRSIAESLCKGAGEGRLVSVPWPASLERAVARNIELYDLKFGAASPGSASAP